jgi:hypothetical protein
MGHHDGRARHGTKFPEPGQRPPYDPAPLSSSRFFDLLACCRSHIICLRHTHPSSSRAAAFARGGTLPYFEKDLNAIVVGCHWPHSDSNSSNSSSSNNSNNNIAMESFGGSQSSPLYGALGSLLEQFHSAFDPSAILDDAARHAFCDSNVGMDAATDAAAAAKGGGKGGNTSSSKQRGPPPSPDGSTGPRRRESKDDNKGGNKDEDGLDAIAKSRARITANRIQNRRLSIGKTRATILTRNNGGSSKNSPAASTTHPQAFGHGYGGGGSYHYHTDYSTSMDSGDVYLTEVDDEDFDEDYDYGEDEEETVPTTSGGINNNAAKGKSKQLAASSSFSPGKGMLASKQLLSQAASLVGCGTGGAHADEDDDEGKDEREERRGGGGGGNGGGRGFRGLAGAVDPCGAARCGSNGGGASSDRDMAPSPPPPATTTTNTPNTIIDLSAYESLDAPYDHLLERVAVMTLQMEKMRDEFDQMRTENAVLIENLTMAGDAAAHVGLSVDGGKGKGLSEDDDEDDNEDDRRMVGAEYDEYYEDGHEEEGRYPTAIRRL